MCAKNKNMYACSEQAIIREIASMISIVATVRSFAHMPLGIFDRNSSKDVEQTDVCRRR